MGVDLCRLGCALFDYFVDDLDNVDKECELDPVVKVVVSWCKDDKNRNILYKNNGDERYPEFKLYKMISRTVHNHTPQSVLETSFFEKYKISKRKIPKKAKIINIDEIPCYV